MQPRLHLNLALKIGTEMVWYSARTPPSTDFCIVSHNMYVSCRGIFKICGVIFFSSVFRKMICCLCKIMVVARGSKVKKEYLASQQDMIKLLINLSFSVLRNRRGRGYGSCYSVVFLLPSPFQQNQLDLNYSAGIFSKIKFIYMVKNLDSRRGVDMMLVIVVKLFDFFFFFQRSKTNFV